MNMLASLAPLAHKTGPDGAEYNSYYVPETGLYLFLRKSPSGAYGYHSLINEEAYAKCWPCAEDMDYVEQSPSGIDFSAIVLRDALQDTVNSNQAVSDAITDNQEKQLENQREIKRYQQITSEKQNLTNTELRESALHVIVDNPEHPSSMVSVSNFPELQKVQVTNNPSTINIGNFPPPVTSVTVNNQPSTYPVTGSFWQSVQPVSGPLTDSQLRASPLPVTFTFPTSQHVTVDNPTTSVTVSNQPTTYPVTGTFWQATQPVSGPLTDVQLRATPIPVSIAFPNSQHVTLDNPTTSVSVLNQPTTYPVTGTFWQATQPVSGTVTVANPVSTVAVSSLPAGFGTSTNQLIANTSLNSIDTKLSSTSTSAKQDVANSSLASIDSKLTSPISVKLIPTTSGGLANKLVVASTIGTTTTVVKSSPGQVYDVIVSNTSGAVIYLNLYNKATAPIATDVPIQLYAVPANQTLQFSFPLGSTYSAGISFSITSNIALLGILTGLLSANQVVVNLEYV